MSEGLYKFKSAFQDAPSNPWSCILLESYLLIDGWFLLWTTIMVHDRKEGVAFGLYLSVCEIGDHDVYMFKDHIYIELL